METWREIVAEMRKSGRFGELNPTMGGVEIKTPMHDFSDRIEAACKTLEDVLIVEQEENAKLRRALEPVMKCDGCPMTQSEIGEVLYAVRKAQAIMRTEDEGQNTKEVV